jgi:protease I
MAPIEQLRNKHIAAIVADGFEQVELTGPLEALDEQGACVDIVSLQPGQVKAWQHDHWGDAFDVQKTADQLNTADYDALLLPGGVMSPDKLRRDSHVIQFIRGMFQQGKPIAAICHGPWTLAEANIIRGTRMTSYPSIQTDLKNAGANWVDEAVVTDDGIVTSRQPDDIPAFNRKMIEEFAEGIHQRQTQPAAH